MRNKNSTGRNFSYHVIQKVWEKAQVVPGYDPDVIRKDSCGAWIRRSMYGLTDKELSTGWEIDHIKPLSKNGTDEISNLQPLQWENNREKSDNHPSWNCFVTSWGNKNLYADAKIRLSDL